MRYLVRIFLSRKKIALQHILTSFDGELCIGTYAGKYVAFLGADGASAYHPRLQLWELN